MININIIIGNPIGEKMANYIVVMDSDVHADSTSAETAVGNSGANILKTFTLNLTYEVSATSDQISNISGLKYSSLSDADSGVSLQTFNTNHFKFIDNRVYMDGRYQDDANADMYTSYSEFTPKFTGSGKSVYLVDSGIDSGHTEFSNASITNLFTTVDGDYDDYSGHGTYVGSLIIGENVGIAKDATLYNVKMFDQLSSNVTLGNVINALDSCLVHHNANNPNDVKVLCAPWVTPQNDLIDAKISEINSSNIVVVAAAGNQGEDVNNYSPAGVNEIITVGAHDNNYMITEFTNTPWDGGVANTSVNNYGAAIDIFAVGVNVSGAESGGVSGYRNGTGTSVATGIVAGGVLSFLEKHPTENSNRIKEILIAEGKYRGQWHLGVSDEAANAGVDLNSINKSVLQIDAGGSDDSGELFGFPSGEVLKVQRGQTANVNLQININASNVDILNFSPLSPWMSFDSNTGILTADTSSLDANMAPKYYLFGMKGKLDGVTLVEEFAVGVYESAESELEGTSSYYYDSDEDNYDLAQSVSIWASPAIPPLSPK